MGGILQRNTNGNKRIGYFRMNYKGVKPLTLFQDGRKEVVSEMSQLPGYTEWDLTTAVRHCEECGEYVGMLLGREWRDEYHGLCYKCWKKHNA